MTTTTTTQESIINDRPRVDHDDYDYCRANQQSRLLQSQINNHDYCKSQLQRSRPLQSQSQRLRLIAEPTTTIIDSPYQPQRSTTAEPTTTTTIEWNPKLHTDYDHDNNARGSTTITIKPGKSRWFHQSNEVARHSSENRWRSRYWCYLDRLHPIRSRHLEAQDLITNRSHGL